MAKRSPLPTAYPTIPSGAWTKVTTIPGVSQLGRGIYNMDTADIFRFLVLVKPNGVADAAWATAVNATYGATAGKPLGIAPSAGLCGGTYEENYDNLTTGDIWVYQGSGGNLVTLAVDEGA